MPSIIVNSDALGRQKFIPHKNLSAHFQIEDKNFFINQKKLTRISYGVLSLINIAHCKYEQIKYLLCFEICLVLHSTVLLSSSLHKNQTNCTYNFSSLWKRYATTSLPAKCQLYSATKLCILQNISKHRRYDHKLPNFYLYFVKNIWQEK